MMDVASWRKAVRQGGGLAVMLAFSLLLHLVLFPPLVGWVSDWNVGISDPPVRVQIISVDDGPPGLPEFSDAEIIPIEAPKPEKPKVEEEKPKPETPDGQIVEIAPPVNQKTPLKADYLAEYNSTVPKETRTEAFKVNPDIIANIYSRESHATKEEIPDVGATTPSTGAMAGGPDLDPGRDGAPRSALPSNYTLTNKAGFAAPTLASSGSDSLAGAPQNDRLDEDLGNEVALNARYFEGSTYFNRIRRMINGYWEQNIRNIPRDTIISKSSYRTVVEATLNRDGGLESVVVVTQSGSDTIDRCLLDAFHMASPFPNPPEQLIGKDGRVQIPDFDFLLAFVEAQNQYRGIDPRSGVQFPGILKNPR